MPLYPCGEPGCDECRTAFGVEQDAAVARKLLAQDTLRALRRLDRLRGDVDRSAAA